MPALKLEPGQVYVPKGVFGFMGAEFGVAVESGGIEVSLRRVITSDVTETLKEMREGWEDTDKTPRDETVDVRMLPVRCDGP